MPVVLVGNKLDLEDNRAISYIDGQSMADKFGFDFFEVSAYTG